MPDYNSFEWEGLKIEGHAAGWRSLPLLAKLPLFSGFRPTFWILVRANDNRRGENTVTARWFCSGPGWTPEETKTASLQKKAKFRVQTGKMMGSGEGHIRLMSLELDSGEKKGPGGAGGGEYVDLVTYDVISVDRLMYWVVTAVVAAVVALVVGIGGTLIAAWAASELFRDHEPRPVFIVTPTPPSQSEPGNSEPESTP